MKEKDDRKIISWNTEKCKCMDVEELKHVFGSGNSQIRYIPDEYLQARIIKSNYSQI